MKSTLLAGNPSVERIRDVLSTTNAKIGIRNAFNSFCLMMNGKVFEPHLESVGCIYWAMAVRAYMIANGADPERCLLNAGSASFKFRDHPTEVTHYSYEFNGNDPGWLALAKVDLVHARKYGVDLPECHAWVVFLNTDGTTNPIVIDPTTKYLKHLVDLIGFTWEMPDPPEMLVSECHSTPEGWKYLAQLMPTALFVIAMQYCLGVFQDAKMQAMRESN